MSITAILVDMVTTFCHWFALGTGFGFGCALVAWATKGLFRIM